MPKSSESTRTQALNKTAGALMTSSVVTASRGTTGDILARQLLTSLLSGLPIVESDGEVVGMVTEFDLLRAYQEGRDLRAIKAEDIMTVPPICVNEDASFTDILRTMTERMVIRIPVVRKGKLLGIVTRTGILSLLVEAAGHSHHLVSLCYWCEKVRDRSGEESEPGGWVDLDVYLERHRLDSQDLTFMHTFCPACTPLVKKVMGEKYPGLAD